MLNALQFITEKIGEPLTVDFIIQLHQIATSDVEINGIVGRGWSIHYGKIIPRLRDHDSDTEYGFGFNVSPKTATVEGLQEISDLYGEFAHFERKRNANENDKLTGRIYIKKHSNIKKKMECIINDYYRSERSTLDIAKFAHEMDLLHPFTDANIRVITFLLINKLLIDEKRPPIIFHDPNIFDAFSNAQLKEFIEREELLSGKMCDNLVDPFGLKDGEPHSEMDIKMGVN